MKGEWGRQILWITLTLILLLSCTHSLSVDLQVEVVSSVDSYNSTSVQIQPAALLSSTRSIPQYTTQELIALTRGAVAGRTDWLWRQAEKWNKLTKFFAEFDLRSYLGLKGGSKGGPLSIQATIIEGHKLQFSVTNNYRKPLCVQKLGLLFENKVWPTGVRVWQGNKQLTQASFNAPILVKKFNEKSFMLLNSGETATVTRDLTDYFKLAPKTQYSVELISFLTYFKRNGQESCKRDSSPVENAQVHKWKSSTFQLDSKFTPVWKKYTSMSTWLKDKHNMITQVSNKVYVASKRKLDKKALVYLLQVHKLTMETLKGAIDGLKNIQNESKAKKVRQAYKRSFGDNIERETISKITDTFNKILSGLHKDPLIFVVCVPCEVFQPIFAIPFHTMVNKGIPLLNLCGGPSYYNHPVNEAVFDTLRGLAHLYTGTSHTFKPLKESQENSKTHDVNLRNKASSIMEQDYEKAYKTSENIAMFAIESVDIDFTLSKVGKDAERSPISKVGHFVRKKIKRGKKSLRNILKRLKQKFTKGKNN